MTGPASRAGTRSPGTGHGVHQRRLDGRAHDASADALGDAVENRTELVVAVTDEDFRPLPEGRRVAQLLRSPLPRGTDPMCRSTATRRSRAPSNRRVQAESSRFRGSAASTVTQGRRDRAASVSRHHWLPTQVSTGTYRVYAPVQP